MMFSRKKFAGDKKFYCFNVIAAFTRMIKSNVRYMYMSYSCEKLYLLHTHFRLYTVKLFARYAFHNYSCSLQKCQSKMTRVAVSKI